MPVGARRSPLWWGCIGAAFFLILWLAVLAGPSLISPDEGRYASLALGMLQSGDWVTPRLNGLIYLEKPPLQYWIGAMSMGLFGANEFAARLWPGLSGLLAVLLLGHTARRLWGAEAGLRALLFGGAMTWIVVNGHFLSLDEGLMALLSLVLCATLLAEHARNASSPLEARNWMLCAWLGVSLAVMTKGLVGIVIPGVSLLLQSLWRRDFSIWQRLRWAPGLAIFTVVVLPWFVLVSGRNADFATFFFVHEHLQRYLTPVHRREGAWWYFIPILLIGSMPWTSGLPWLLKGKRDDFTTSLLLVWAIFVFVFFSISDSKLPSYILPMFPALTLLLVRASERVTARALRMHLWAPLGLWTLALVCVPFASRFSSDDTPQAAVTALARGVGAGAALFIVVAAVAWRLLRRGKCTQALGAVGGAHLVATLMVLCSYNTYGQLKSSAAIARALAPHVDLTTPVYAVRTYDQTLPFYLRRPVILVDYVDEFEFGEKHEPERWIPTLDGFAARWVAEPRAAAYLQRTTLDELQARGLKMRIVFEDSRRLMVVKP